MERPTSSSPGHFSGPLAGETIRALLLFLGLFLILSAIGTVLALRELDLKGVSERLEVAQAEARLIAQAAAAVVRTSGKVDLQLLENSDKGRSLQRVIEDHLDKNPIVRQVEIVDTEGKPVLFVARNAGAGTISHPPSPGDADSSLEAGEEPILRWAVGSPQAPAGEVRVGLDPAKLHGRVEALRSSLRFWFTVAASAGILVLVVSFSYVLHLIRKNRRLEQSRLAAERRSYVGLLASGLAHEIRNPLNAMNMNLQMLEEELQSLPGLDRGDHLELLASTTSEIKRLERLVNNFLAYARPSQPRFESHDMNELLGDVARFLQADFQQSQVQLAVDLESMLPPVDIDETQFKQALMNLLVNARQVLKSGGRVVLRSRALPSGEVLVEVQDDGPGIPADVREKIFEVFYSNRGGGTGLGLPIARQIVERHGGRIEVVGAAPRGTTFRIRLPRRHERAPSLATPPLAS